MTVIRDLRLLHPKFGRAAGLLDQHLARAHEAGVTKTRFKVFETFRDARRQEDLLKKRVTKAGMYQSAHAYGLAADFVPFITPFEAERLAQAKGEAVFPGWNWDPSHDWAFLKKSARDYGVDVPIEWDLAHVEHPDFKYLRDAWMKIKQK